MALRRPYWTTDAFAISINGQPVAADQLADPHVPAYGRRRGGRDSEDEPRNSYYVRLTRTWKTGDTVEVTLPKHLRLEPLPDNPRRVVILWGPLVLAGDLGPEPTRGRRQSWRERERIPVMVAADQPVADWLQPVPGKPGHFRSMGVGRERDVAFSPFYRLHRRSYGVYWDLFTPPEWEVKAAEYAAEEERQRKLEAATLAYVQPGEMQPERNFNFQTGDERPRPLRTDGRPGRGARTWFSVDLPVDTTASLALVITYCSAERSRSARRFDILVQDQTIATQTVEREEPLRFYDVTYAVPAATVQGKEKVTVKFQAREDSSVAGVYGIRLIKAVANQ